MNEVLNKIVRVLTKPKDFYASLSKEEGVQKAFIYLAVISIFSILASIFLYSLLGGAMSSLFSQRDNTSLLPFSPVMYVTFGIVAYVLNLGTSFVVGAVEFIWLWLFGGRKGYAKAYQLAIYSYTPSHVIGWIPYLGGFLSGIWGTVLLIIGTKEIYKFSTRKAIFVHVLPFLLIVIFGTTIALIVGFGVAALFQQGLSTDTFMVD